VAGVRRLTGVAARDKITTSMLAPIGCGAVMGAPSPPHPARLPTPLTRLVGRAQALDELCDLLLQPHTRIVTLSGPGGVGKTRLAIAAAEVMSARFSGDVSFIALAALADPALVAATLASTLGLTDSAGREAAERLAAHFADRSALLVLDNFEQLTDAAPLVGMLAEQCSRLRILVTSRMPLHVSGEQLYPVPPLPLPRADGPPALEQLEQVDAVALFVQRAREHRADFRLTHDNASAVVEICQRLDGLPLALELAAARIALLTPRSILERLNQQLTVLAGASRDAPQRQRTMRGALAWSYDLLDPASQRLLRQLAIFVGGWTLAAAEAICDADLAVFDGLATLTDHSLIYHVEQADGGTRFQMLETIRAFGREQAANGEDQHAVEARHAAFYVGLAEQACPGLVGREQERAIANLEADLDNLRAAWTWLERHGATAAALGARLLRVQGWMWVFWRGQGRVHEGRQRIQALLAATDAPAAARASALNALGVLAAELNEAPLASASHREALKLARAEADRFEEIQALWGLGRAAEWNGDTQAGIPWYEEALSVTRTVGNRRFLLPILNNLGLAWSALGEHPRAATLYHEALRVAQEEGYELGTALALSSLAEDALIHARDVPAAAAFSRQALLVHQASQSRPSRFSAELLELCARIAVARALPEMAARLFGAAAGIRALISTPVPANERPLQERAHADARQPLGEQAWQHSWSAGFALRLDEALTYAIEALDAPPAPEPDTPSAGSMLSPREREVVRLLVEGKTNQEVAAALFISPSTAANHVANVMNKLGLDSRTAVATWAVRHGFA
jgi:non-specific serine/threonine protein kinase